MKKYNIANITVVLMNLILGIVPSFSNILGDFSFLSEDVSLLEILIANGLEILLLFSLITSTLGLLNRMKWAYALQLTLSSLDVIYIHIGSFLFRVNVLKVFFFFDFSPRFMEGVTIGIQVFPLLIIFILLFRKKEFFRSS